MDHEMIVVSVYCGTQHQEIHVRKGENLLMAMVRHNLPVSFQCASGKCATCRLRMDIPAGSAEPVSETERYRLGERLIAAGFRLACRLSVEGSMTVWLDPDSSH